MTGEPLVKEALAQYPALVWAAYIAVIGGVLAGGLLANHGKARARVAKHLVDVAITPVAAAAKAGITKGEADMLKILVPVNGSATRSRRCSMWSISSWKIMRWKCTCWHVRTPLSPACRAFHQQARPRFVPSR